MRLESDKNYIFFKSVNKHMCFLKILLENIFKIIDFLTFCDKTGVPDDAKMSTEKEE